MADHGLDSISGHLSRRMLEHYPHIRIDAKRQALDALDPARKRTAASAAIAREADASEYPQSLAAVLEVRESAASQSRHSLRLAGSPPSGTLLIPLSRRDVRVVEGARLEIQLTVRDGVLSIAITVTDSDA